MTTWDFFWSVIAIVLVIEGFLPALCPVCWRNFMRALLNRDDTLARYVGLGMMAAGAIILVIVHHVM